MLKDKNHMNVYILPISNVKEKKGVLQNSLKGAGLGGVLNFIVVFHSAVTVTF